MKFAFLGIEDPVLIAAVVAFLTAVATSPLTFLVQRALLRQKAKTDYEFEQRRELRSLIGRYHGRMLEAADSFQHRLFNLYVNVGEGWLNVKGDYRPEQFYFSAPCTASWRCTGWPRGSNVRRSSSTRASRSPLIAASSTTRRRCAGQ